MKHCERRHGEVLNFWCSFKKFIAETRKIPIYELSKNDRFCHNKCRGAIFMAKKICRYISELLQVYQAITQKTCMEMALDFDITVSNLYHYRNGDGNPTANTIDKIIAAIEQECPEALEEVVR